MTGTAAADGARDKPSNWNLPNALTTLRIVMVPFFAVALLHDGGADSRWRWVAYGLFVIAMATDKIDGDLARKRGQVTDFGKIADPIADKAITGMAFVGLSLVGEVWWWVTALVLFREWSVTIARLSIARQVVMAASRSGKAKTMAQGLALGGLVAPFRHLPGLWHVPGLVVWAASVLLLAVAVVLTVFSGVEFARDALRTRRSLSRS